MHAWRGFQRSPNPGVLVELPETASADEIVEYVQTRADIMDSASYCFWWGKSGLSCKNTMLCLKCREISYCGKECQANDGKAFHRKECKQLEKGKTREEVGMEMARNATLRMYNAYCYLIILDFCAIQCMCQIRLQIFELKIIDDLQILI
mmetsp:Transcript_29575/g.48801  ORF Transcript_29575/g.48801 Transcript_29575/m.48801 type:complete len:150 (-) Transcript_29575:773-1222(-)